MLMMNKEHRLLCSICYLYDRMRLLSCGFESSVGRAVCTGIAEVVGSNPAQSLNFFQVSVLVVLRPHLH